MHCLNTNQRESQQKDRQSKKKINNSTPENRFNWEIYWYLNDNKTGKGFICDELETFICIYVYILVKYKSSTTVEECRPAKHRTTTRLSLSIKSLVTRHTHFQQSRSTVILVKEKIVSCRRFISCRHKSDALVFVIKCRIDRVRFHSVKVLFLSASWFAHVIYSSAKPHCRQFSLAEE